MRNGFTLVEALVSVTILDIALAAVLPTFMNFSDANTLNEIRTGAVAAAQQTIEELRQVNPASLPASGSSSVTLVPVGGRTFEVVVRYCASAEFCGLDSRHLLVEVSFGGRTLYTLESVFTQLA